MKSQHTGKMTTVGFYASEVEHAAAVRSAAKAGETQAGWVRKILMNAAAKELGVPYATLDRYNPAYGKGYTALSEELRGPRNRRQAELEAATQEAQEALDRAKRAAAAKLAEALAELEALGSDTGVKPRRR
jgi:hypothetical protein